MTTNLNNSQEKSLKQRALEYLSKREYSAAELGKKLQTYADESDDIPGLLNEFKTRGWLSDKRFTEQIVRARKTKFGSAKIAHELREKGVADELIEDAVSEVQESRRGVCTGSPGSLREWKPGCCPQGSVFVL